MKSIILFPLLVIVLIAILERAPSCCVADDKEQSFQQNMLMFESRWLNRSSIDKSFPRVCCHSDTLQGTIRSYDMDSRSVTLMQFYHDAKNCRLALVNKTPFRPGPYQRAVVQCYSGQICIAFLINDQLRRCSKLKYAGATLDSFWHRCIPGGAMMSQRMAMGGDYPGQPPLKVKMWNFISNDGAYTRFSRIVTDRGCIPVADVEATGARRMTDYYFDVKSYILNTTALNIPWFCH